jgi:hypothetical protein
MDSVLLFATVAFAFLAASFAAANSDLWMHLATGRLIAAGEYHFGSDPFAYITAGQYWANHSWLFDLAFFELFRLGGGGTLVAVKAAGVAMLAAVMLRLALRGKGSVWLAAGSVLLAVLVISPRLLLQPQCLSLLLFAVGLNLVAAGGRAARWLPALMVLWVNVDAWFVLGLWLAVVHGIVSRGAADAGSRLIGWRLVVLCFAACLLNPHHIRAFTLPPELDPDVWSRFGDDPHFAGFFASPWHLTGLASWAFPVLLGLSGLSFLFNPRTILGWRLLTWLPLALLAAWQARLVPFFAVAAGPILALNFGEAISDRFLKWGRRGTALAAVGLLILSWPGWLQSFQARDRGVAWRLAPDPSQVRAATIVHERKMLSVDHVGPDTAHYLAWFAPGVQSKSDSRLQLFAWVNFQEMPVPPCAIYPYAELPRGHVVMEVAGSLVISDPKRPVFNAEQAAFSPAVSPVPETGPLNEPAEWWNLAAHRQAPRTWEGEAAPTFLQMFEVQAGQDKNPALPLLATRFARASLAAEPRGDQAWTALALGYRMQSRGSWEAAASADFPLVRHLRHVQTVGALQQAVLANPDNIVAHELLAIEFGERRLLDFALHHRREQLRLLKRISGSAETQARVQEVITALEAEVFEAENRFLVHTDALIGKPLDRARIARELGLGFTAIDALAKSHPDLYGVEGLRLLLDLLLQTGRLGDARVLLDREELARNPASLDLFVLPGGVKDGRPWRYALPAYRWFDFCQQAAAGRYDAAETSLRMLQRNLADVERGTMPHISGVQLRVVLGELGGSVGLHRMVVRLENETWSLNAADTKFLASIRGDLLALSGLLHLERGMTREAELDFRHALEQYAENSGPAAVHPGRSLVLKYRDALGKP